MNWGHRPSLRAAPPNDAAVAAPPDAAVIRGRASQGCHGGARPRTNANDHGHLQPRHARPRPRRRRPDGQCAVETAGTVKASVATTLAPETTQAALRKEN